MDLIFDRFSPAERSVAEPRVADLVAAWNEAQSAPLGRRAAR